MKNMKRISKGICMSRILAMTLCVSVVLSMSGCATTSAIADGKGFSQVIDAIKIDLFGSEEQECRWLSLSLPVRSGFEPVNDKSAYNSLKDDAMRQVYEMIEESIYQVSSEKDEENGYYLLKYTRLPSELEYDDIYIVKEAVINDHPEAFWVMSSYDIQNNFHDGNYLVLYSKYSYDEINAAFDEINAATENILAQIPDKADELQREIIIHDALVDEISYDLEAAASDDSTADAFNIYGALVNKKAVCSGYAYAAKMLLNRVGIECRTVVGMSKNSGHMWNQVKINDNWYHLDITWDDPPPEKEVNYSRYNYFNLTDDMVQINHKIGKNFSEMVCEYTDDGVYTTAELYNFDLNECNSVEENYYELYAAHVNNMNSSAMSDITDKIVDASKTKEELVYIIFDKSISNADAEAWLANNSGKKYSALAQSVANANKYAIGARVSKFTLARMSSNDGSSDDESIWTNLYAVRLIYA